MTPLVVYNNVKMKHIIVITPPNEVVLALKERVPFVNLNAGLSESYGTYTLQQMADDAILLLDALGINRAYLSAAGQCQMATGGVCMLRQGRVVCHDRCSRLRCIHGRDDCPAGAHWLPRARSQARYHHHCITACAH